MKRYQQILLSMATMTASVGATVNVSASAVRPPQYVLLAFDGSKDISMWERTRQLGKDAPVKLTYFVSGVYFLTDANKKMYHPPAGIAVGRSDIGFGGTAKDIETRIKEVLLAKDEGHEMGSHANGHFDGAKWSTADWQQEFSEFDRLIGNVFQNNNLSGDSSAWSQQIAGLFNGFRAPLLGRGAGLWETLKENKYIYDTSSTSAPTLWPRRSPEGFWSFPLASLTIAGTAKKTLSMDYNFYYADSGGKPDPQNASIYEDRMYKTYMDYFTKNYYGNRAPVHIGHHFSQWNGGAYLRAYEHFAKTVCGLPEVKCINYHELVQVLDHQTPEVLNAWQKADFPKFDQHPLAETNIETKDVNLSIVGENSDLANISVEGRDASSLLKQGGRLEVSVNGDVKPVLMTQSFRKDKFQLNLASLGHGKPFKLAVTLRDSKNQEIQKTEHMVEMTQTGYTVLPVDQDEKMRLTADPSDAHDE